MKLSFSQLLYFLSMLLLLGCRKEPDELSLKTRGFSGLRRPVPAGFTVDSRSYTNEEGLDRRRSGKRASTNATEEAPEDPFSPRSSAYRDGPGTIVQKDDPRNQGEFNLFFHQRYKSQMFTVSDVSMGLHIYPGAILDGRSIEGMFESSMLEGVSGNIRPISISTSMPVSGSAVARTSLPRPIAEKALYNAALTDLEELNPGGVGAASLQVVLDSFTVYEELKTLYGYNKDLDVFLLNSNTVKQGENHHITAKSAMKLKFFQHNFTIDMDVPNSYNELFDPTGLDMDTLGGGVVPVYVKSVTYGRMGIMVIESEYSSDKVYNAIYKQLGILKNLIGIDKTLTEEEKAIINSADIRVKYTGIGADSDGLIKVNGLEGFIDILSSNNSYSKESPGVPVAFQLAYLDTHGLVEAPFQINYGPFDKPYARIEYKDVTENRQTSGDRSAIGSTYTETVVENAGAYIACYRDPEGKDPLDVPGFLLFKYQEMVSTSLKGIYFVQRIGGGGDPYREYRSLDSVNFKHYGPLHLIDRVQSSYDFYRCNGNAQMGCIYGDWPSEMVKNQFLILQESSYYYILPEERNGYGAMHEYFPNSVITNN